MTPELERAIKAHNGYHEQKQSDCRYCLFVRDALHADGPRFKCHIAGKLGGMPVSPSGTCDLFEERK